MLWCSKWCPLLFKRGQEREGEGRTGENNTFFFLFFFLVMRNWDFQPHPANTIHLDFFMNFFDLHKQPVQVIPQVIEQTLG